MRKKAGPLASASDGFPDFIKSHAQPMGSPAVSSSVVSTLLEYLREKRGIDLTASNYDELSDHLSGARGSAYFILTNEHRKTCLDRLVPATFQESELRDYFNDFSSSDEKDAGRLMLLGVEALGQALGRVDDKSIILLGVG